jgi:hypothetical protein
MCRVAILAFVVALLAPLASAGPAADLVRAVGCVDAASCEAAWEVALVVEGVEAQRPSTEDLARFVVCSPVGQLACFAMSGDPGIGPFRPCTSPRSPSESPVGGLLWHAMQGGNFTFEGVFVQMPAGADPLAAQLTGGYLAGTPLEGERPCADHWRTLRSLVP